ncbi:immunoglobulin-like domain-containing protein [Agathobaculum sp.]|uniref:immunoglobulin-like domain-containing protein n=1 Tax=Agathobaculum sp. TaxID=2048138 RepID=UPI002A818D29|nr:immunoglobulin-like domain-containing protein [Agathobaculum sp.]MDY3619187.1 immunoglobulin-like domain-containing protein [Agathobaculum sp.]
MKRFLAFACLLLPFALAACGTQADTNTIDPADTDPAMLSSTDEPEPLRIELPADSFSASDERIAYTVVNDSGEALEISPVPRLEAKTEDGWQKVEFADVGFCGTHDLLEVSQDDVLELDWFDPLPPGSYRIVRSIYEAQSTDDTPPAQISAEFSLTE